MSNAEEAELGLVSQHDYAVVQLKEMEGRRMLLVKNPWSNGLVWKHRSEETNLPRLDAILDPGSFWIDLDQVMQNFESMYFNWNPDIFSHHQDVHFIWKIEDNPSGCFRTNPQYSIKSRKGGVAWLLLSHHFQSDTKIIDDSRAGKPGSAFISLYAFAQDGRRVLLSDGAIHKGPYVDAPQTLLRLDIPPETPYTIVVAQESLPTKSQRFTLSAFSLTSLTLQPAIDIYTHWTSHHSGWTHYTAGGNASSPTYSDNPQFSLHLTSPSSIALLLETTDNDNIPIHLKLVYSAGERITALTARSIVKDSGDYRRGCAVIEFSALLDPGKYTIIPSTFEPGQVGKFTLHIGCSTSPNTYTIRPIPSETAGRLSLRLPPAIFTPSINKLRIPLYPQRMTRLRLIGRTTQTPTKGIRSPLKFRIELHHPSEVKWLTHSGEEFNSSGVLRTGDVDLVPDMMHREGGAVWVILERMSMCAGSNDDDGGVTEEEVEIVQVDILSDARLEFGRTWENHRYIAAG